MDVCLSRGFQGEYLGWQMQGDRAAIILTVYLGYPAANPQLPEHRPHRINLAHMGGSRIHAWSAIDVLRDGPFSEETASESAPPIKVERRRNSRRVI
jgi:hypothetical protein